MTRRIVFLAAGVLTLATFTVAAGAPAPSAGTTATPPPVPDQAPPEGSAHPSVAGAASSGGGTGADTSVATEATAGPAPLVQIATPARVGAFPTTGGFASQLLVIGLTSLGVGVLAMAGSALQRRGRKAAR